MSVGSVKSLLYLINYVLGPHQITPPHPAAAAQQTREEGRACLRVGARGEDRDRQTGGSRLPRGGWGGGGKGGGGGGGGGEDGGQGEEERRKEGGVSERAEPVSGQTKRKIRHEEATTAGAV